MTKKALATCSLSQKIQILWFQKVSEYDQEKTKSHTADQPKASWGEATEHLQ